jgi:hypothetical protein
MILRHGLQPTCGTVGCAVNLFVDGTFGTLQGPGPTNGMCVPVQSRPQGAKSSAAHPRVARPRERIGVAEGSGGPLRTHDGLLRSLKALDARL